MIIAPVAAVTSLVLALVSGLGARERARHVDGQSMFRMERSLVFGCVAISVGMVIVAATIMIRSLHGGSRSAADAGAPACIALLASGCAYIWTVYRVKLEGTVLRMGLYGHRTVPYAEVKAIREIRGQGSPRAKLILASNQVINIWSNLVGFDDLITQLREKCPAAQHSVGGPLNDT